MILLLLVLVATYAVDKNLTKAKTILVDDNKTVTRTELNSTSRSSPITPLPSLPLIGRVDVIGGTAYDWVNGPVTTWCVNDPTYGIHTTWQWSNDPLFADRNMRYNFYDWSTHTWSWLSGTSYMQYGIPVFPHTLSSVAGGADVDPITGNFVICGQYTPTGQQRRPKLARDVSPGAGLFEYTESPPTWFWPFIAVDSNEAVHLAVINAVVPNETLYYSRCQPWGTWSAYTRVCPPLDEPLGPTQNIQASHISNKVIITWTHWRTSTLIDSGYYRLSNDGGQTWQDPVALPFPPSTLDTPAFHIGGMFAHFDQNDNFHIVTQIGTSYYWPAEIWHYCPTNNPAWSRVFLRDADTIAVNGNCGYNTLCACRPSITRNPSNNYLYATWECFDSLNFEPLTSKLRADIWVAESRDNGLTWPRKTRITTPDSTSKRFPVAGGVQVTPGPTPDTLIVMYLVDSIAGAFVQGEHRYCVNPIVCHFVPVPLPDAIEEGNPSNPIYNFALNSAYPNPSNSATKISYSVSTTNNNVELTIYDVLGRPVRTLVNGTKSPGEYSANWDGRALSGEKVKAGVYFYTLKSSEKTITKKLIITK